MLQAVDAAKRTLAQYWDKTLPVNSSAIAYRMGVQIFFVPDLPVSGCFDNDGEGKPVIYVNPSESAVRQRFTIFHEMGHYVLGHGPSPRHIDPGYDKSHYNPKETAANQFAAEMIMPEGAVRLLAQNHSLAELAAVFSVSERAMAIRLQRLHLTEARA